jgi:hypothetical protein
LATGAGFGWLGWVGGVGGGGGGWVHVLL